MTTTVIDLAESALALNAPLRATAGPATSNLQGRPVAHWSYKVAIGGAAIGLIAMIAFHILNMVPAAIVAGVLMVTDLFSAYFLHKFRLYDQLEDYVKLMAERIQVFNDQIQELKRTNTHLENIGNEMEVVPNRWREEIENGKKEILEVHKKFAVLKKSYDSVLDKLSKFSALSKTLQKEASSLAKETVKFGGENKLLGENIKIISENLEAYQKHNADIGARNKELDQANQELDRLEKEFTKSVEMISGLFGAVKEIYQKNGEILITFDKKIAELKELYPDIKASHDEMLALNGQISELKKKIEDLIKKKVENKELRALNGKDNVELKPRKRVRRRVKKT